MLSLNRQCASRTKNYQPRAAALHYLSRRVYKPAIVGQTANSKRSSAPDPQPQDSVLTLLLDEMKTLRSGMQDEMKMLRSEMQNEMKTLRSEMQNEMKTLRSEMQDELKTLRSGMQDEMKALRSELHTGMQAIGSEVQKLRQQQGYLVETQLRGAASNIFGQEYSRPVLVRSLVDLVRLVPPASLASSALPEMAKERKEDTELRRIALAKAAARKLLEEQVPSRLMGVLYDALKASRQYPQPRHPWFDSNGQLLESNLGQYLASCGNAPLKEVLHRLRAAIVDGDEETRVEQLIRCQSAGIICVVAAAFPADYLEKGAKSKLRPPVIPSPELEFDCKGRVEVGRKASYAVLDIGEVKVALDYKKVVPQLSLRLGVLKWLVCECLGVQPAAVTSIGRMFASAAAASTHEVDVLQQQVAEE